MFKNKIVILALCCYGQNLFGMGSLSAARNGLRPTGIGFLNTARTTTTVTNASRQAVQQAHTIRPLTKTRELTSPSSGPASPIARPVSPRIQQALDTFTPQHQPAIDYKALIRDVKKITDGHTIESTTAALTAQQARNAATIERVKQSIDKAQTGQLTRQQQELEKMRQQNQDRIMTIESDFKKAMAENAALKAQLAKSQTKHTKATKKIAQLTEDKAISKINAKANQQDLELTASEQLKLKKENVRLQEQLNQYKLMIQLQKTHNFRN